MSRKNLKIIGIALLSLLIDITRPLGYIFLANTTFLVLIALSFYNKTFFIIFIAFALGIAQDALIFSSKLFYAIEYPLAVAVVILLNKLLHFIKTKNHPLVLKALIAALLILIHTFLLALTVKSAGFFYPAYFFVQSYLIFFFINGIIEKTLRKI
jgi:cell shape-determining protein MreD